MLRYDRQTKPGLVTLYNIRPGKGVGLFLQPQSPYGAAAAREEWGACGKKWNSNMWNLQYRHTNTRKIYFTGHMSILSSTQQCQSTERIISTLIKQKKSSQKSRHAITDHITTLTLPHSSIYAVSSIRWHHLLNTDKVQWRYGAYAGSFLYCTVVSFAVFSYCIIHFCLCVHVLWHRYSVCCI